MPDADLLFRPVHELAGRVRSGELGARELVSLSLDRIAALEPEIGAFVDVDAERALATAHQIGPGDPRPFAGVPIAVKNNKPVQGLRLTFCAQLMGDFVPSHDAFLVRRLREAGFVIVGTTKLPEFGILPTTEPSRFGPAHNPWDLGRTPGGSSGGSAASVAAGMVPIAHGNDGGGSTRIPAACCGLVGLKPTRGRISQGPDLGDSLLSIDGVLTRSVAETAALLDLLAGYETGDATWAPPPPEPFATAAARDPGRLRIALTTSPPIPDHTVDPVCEAAARDAASLLEGLGHEVVEATPPWSIPGLFESFSAVFGPLVSTAIGFGSLLAGRPPTQDDVEALSWYLWERALQNHSLDYLGATLRLQAATRAIVSFFDDVDVLLTPSLGERPLALGELDATAGDPAATFRRSGAFTPFTAVANVTGQPAISLPLYHGEDGLPTGVQLFGRPAEEGTLLSLATQLEAANPWADRRAPVVAGAEA